VAPGSGLEVLADRQFRTEPITYEQSIVEARERRRRKKERNREVLSSHGELKRSSHNRETHEISEVTGGVIWRKSARAPAGLVQNCDLRERSRWTNTSITHPEFVAISQDKRRMDIGGLTGLGSAHSKSEVAGGLRKVDVCELERSQSGESEVLRCFQGDVLRRGHALHPSNVNAQEGEEHKTKKTPRLTFREMS